MRRALLVGIDEYASSPLAGCVNDANSMHEVLSRHEDGSPNFDCKLLTAPDDYIDRAVLRKNINELFAFEADVAMFYFAGHGTINILGGYLVTPDAKQFDEGVKMGDLLDLANKAKINEVVIILDCCHSGYAGTVSAIDTEKAILREGVSVLTASRGTQTAAEVGGSGVFTKLVYDALKGGAADVCGNVTAAAIYTYVDQLFGAWEQRPLFKSHVSKFIPLRHCKPEVEPPLLRLIPKYFKKPTDEYKLSPSYEPDAEPKNEKHQKIFAHLQKYRAARLLVPVGEEHMYFAAINSKSCKLTPLGQFYWYLAKRGKI